MSTGGDGRVGVRAIAVVVAVALTVAIWTALRGSSESEADIMSPPIDAAASVCESTSLVDAWDTNTTQCWWMLNASRACVRNLRRMDRCGLYLRRPVPHTAAVAAGVGIMFAKRVATAAGGRHVVVAGDSSARQFFLRLVSLVRADTTSGVEAQRQLWERYFHCDAVYSVYATAGAGASGGGWDDLSIDRDGHCANSTDEAWPVACSRAGRTPINLVLRVTFVWDPFDLRRTRAAAAACGPDALVTVPAYWALYQKSQPAVVSSEAAFGADLAPRVVVLQFPLPLKQAAPRARRWFRKRADAIRDLDRSRASNATLSRPGAAWASLDVASLPSFAYARRCDRMHFMCVGAPPLGVPVQRRVGLTVPCPSCASPVLVDAVRQVVATLGALGRSGSAG